MKTNRAHDRQHRLPPNRTLSDYPYALSEIIFNTDQLFLSTEKVLPGRRASAPHYHKSVDEIIYVTKGELCAFEGEEHTILKAGDSVCFSANSKQLHYLENQTTEEAEFLVFRPVVKSSDASFT